MPADFSRPDLCRSLPVSGCLPPHEIPLRPVPPAALAQFADGGAHGAAAAPARGARGGGDGGAGDCIAGRHPAEDGGGVCCRPGRDPFPRGRHATPGVQRHLHEHCAHGRHVGGGGVLGERDAEQHPVLDGGRVDPAGDKFLRPDGAGHGQHLHAAAERHPHHDRDVCPEVHLVAAGQRGRQRLEPRLYHRGAAGGGDRAGHRQPAAKPARRPRRHRHLRGGCIRQSRADAPVEEGHVPDYGCDECDADPDQRAAVRCRHLHRGRHELRGHRHQQRRGPDRQRDLGAGDHIPAAGPHAGHGQLGGLRRRGLGRESHLPMEQERRPDRRGHGQPIPFVQRPAGGRSQLHRDGDECHGGGHQQRRRAQCRGLGRSRPADQRLRAHCLGFGERHPLHGLCHGRGGHERLQATADPRHWPDPDRLRRPGRDGGSDFGNLSAGPDGPKCQQ